MDALNILKYAVGLDAPDPHWVFIDSAADHSAIKQTSVNYDTGMTLEGFSADASPSNNVPVILMEIGSEVSRTVIWNSAIG